MKKLPIQYIYMLCLGIALLTTVSCAKEPDQIPHVSMNLSLQVEQYARLWTPGGYEYITGGYNGLVVYRVDEYSFRVYDRACPHDYEKNCRVYVDESGLMLIDSACGSRYNILDGGVIDGPASSPLKAYRNRFDGIYLYITN